MVVANHQLATAFLHTNSVASNRTASKQVWWISHKKLISQQRPRPNVEISLVYTNLCGTLGDYLCFLSYGHGMNTVGSRRVPVFESGR